MKNRIHLILACFSTFIFSCHRGANSGNDANKPDKVYAKMAFNHPDILPMHFDGGELLLRNVPLPACYFQGVLGKNSPTEYHVNSFGDTQWKFTLLDGNTIGDFSRIKIYGPFKDKVGRPVKETEFNENMVSNSGELKLETPGVYRVVVNCTAQSIKQQFKATCKENCGNPAVDRSEVIGKEVEKLGGRDPQSSPFIQVLGVMYAKLLGKEAQKISDAALATIKNEIIPKFIGTERFPVLTKKLISAARSAQAVYDNVSAKKMVLQPVTYKTNFMDNFSGCAIPAPPSYLTPATSLISSEAVKLLSGHNIIYGSFSNLSMTDCQQTMSDTFSGILTALAANSIKTEGKFILSYNGKNSISTPMELIDALMDSGHAVTLRNMKSYADFISYLYFDKDFKNPRDLRWPTWIDSDIPLPTDSDIPLPTGSTKTLQVPMNHSELILDISGTDIIARVTFFLGISGVGFWPENYLRPEWTGERTVEWHSSIQSDTERKYILSVVDAMQQYYAQIKSENRDIQDMLDGYGKRGVCNDSVATVLALASQITGKDKLDIYTKEFPLIRVKNDNSLVSSLPKTPVTDVFGMLFHDADHVVDQKKGLADIEDSYVKSTLYRIAIGTSLYDRLTLLDGEINPATGYLRQNTKSQLKDDFEKVNKTYGKFWKTDDNEEGVEFLTIVRSGEVMGF